MYVQRQYVYIAYFFERGHSLRHDHRQRQSFAESRDVSHRHDAGELGVALREEGEDEEEEEEVGRDFLYVFVLLFSMSPSLFVRIVGSTGDVINSDFLLLQQQRLSIPVCVCLYTLRRLRSSPVVRRALIIRTRDAKNEKNPTLLLGRHTP